MGALFLVLHEYSVSHSAGVYFSDIGTAARKEASMSHPSPRDANITMTSMYTRFAFWGICVLCARCASAGERRSALKVAVTQTLVLSDI